MKIKIGIHGITPLIMNRFTEAAEISVSGGTTVTLRGDRGSPREQASAKRYADDADRLYIPGPNIFAAIVAAGTFHKVGRAKVTTSRSSLVPAGIVIEDIVCPITDANGVALTEWEVDSRSVVIPATGGRVMAHRPRLDEWFSSFTLDVDTTMFTPNFVRSLVDDAGKKIGLGDYRHSRKGPFGRFVVTGWSQTDN